MMRERRMSRREFALTGSAAIVSLDEGFSPRTTAVQQAGKDSRTESSIRR